MQPETEAREDGGDLLGLSWVLNFPPSLLTVLNGFRKRYPDILESFGRSFDCQEAMSQTMGVLNKNLKTNCEELHLIS